MVYNKNGEVKLTMIFIAIATAIVVMTLSMSSYSTFLLENDVEVSGTFRNLHGNISAQQSSIDGIVNEASKSGNIYDVVKTATEGVLAVFVTGLASIGAFFQMVTLSETLFSTIKVAIPGFDALIGLLILIATIYVVMRLINSRRGIGGVS